MAPATYLILFCWPSSSSSLLSCTSTPFHCTASAYKHSNMPDSFDPLLETINSMLDVDALHVTYDAMDGISQPPAILTHRPRESNSNTLPRSSMMREENQEGHINGLMGFGRQHRVKSQETRPDETNPVSSSVGQSTELESAPQDTPVNYSRKITSSAERTSSTHPESLSAEAQTHQLVHPLLSTRGKLRVTNVYPSSSERPSRDPRDDSGVAITTQLCECETPQPVAPHQSTATETLVIRYPHIITPQSRYGERTPSTSPGRLPNDYRPSTAFSFERSASPTPFSSPGATFAPPNDPYYAIHHAISGPELELNAVIASMARPLRRTMWLEEIRAIKEDVNALVLGSTRERVQIRYDAANENEAREMGITSKTGEKKPKKGNFRWWKWNLFKRKKAIEQFSLVNAAGVVGHAATINGLVQEALRSTHNTSSTTPTPLPRPSFPDRRRDKPHRRLAHISTLGQSQRSATPSTPSPLRQAHQAAISNGIATPAPKKKKLTKQGPVPYVCVEKKPWWRIGRKTRALPGMKGYKGKGKKAVVTPVQQASVREDTGTVL